MKMCVLAWNWAVDSVPLATIAYARLGNSRSTAKSMVG